MGQSLELSEASERIAQTIPFGAENAVTRKHLASQLGLSDRKMRLHIQQARDEGLIILNLQDGRGYYQSADVNEMTAQYWQDKARALTILKRLKAMRKILKEAGVRV